MGPIPRFNLEIIMPAKTSNSNNLDIIVDHVDNDKTKDIIVKLSNKADESKLLPMFGHVPPFSHRSSGFVEES